MNSIDFHINPLDPVYELARLVFFFQFIYTWCTCEISLLSQNSDMHCQVVEARKFKYICLGLHSYQK